MKPFEYAGAASLEEAVSTLEKYPGKAKLMAGGTDLLGQMMDNILPEYPDILVNIKTIPEMDYITEEDEVIKVGALTRLEDIAKSALINRHCTALAEAAGRVASPHVREMGTIAGNICQSIRCWYYWFPGNRFHCIRKGGKTCNAFTGKNGYHSIFGAVRVGPTPCTSNCPASVDIPSYLSEIRQGNLLAAARILLDRNPIAAITGRVCHHFCEDDCNRREWDKPISIRSVERFLGGYILENAGDLLEFPELITQKSVAVVGAGPAGLSAAYYLRRSGHRVVVYDKMKEAGGMLAYGIPPYRLPKDVVRRQVRAFENAGIEFRREVEIGKDVSIASLRQQFDAVFLACGAWRERELGIEGEDLMTSGLEFLRNINLGISKNSGSRVAVIGGGNVAVDVARSLLRFGASPVVIYRRSQAEMPALREEVVRAQEENIEFQFLTQPREIHRSGSKVVLDCVRTALGPADSTGRPQPLPVEGSEFTSEFDAVFKAIGEAADISFIPTEFVDSQGRMKVDEGTHLLGGNLFVGGDFATGPGTVVQAIAGGKEGAAAIDRYLRTEAGEPQGERGQSAQRFDMSCLERRTRVELHERPVAERTGNMNVEDVAGLSPVETQLEASRCFNCGCVAVNPSDTAPALVALNARIRTTKRVVEAERFFAVQRENTMILDSDEIVTEIEIPKPRIGTRTCFAKFALRKSIDFPIVNCAAAMETEQGTVTGARICLNAVFNRPYRAAEAEQYMVGRAVDEPAAEAAATAAIKDTCPLAENRYKIAIAKALVKKTILRCRS